jgi:hypothetical protein
MATPKEQHDARSRAMNTGSWRHDPDVYDEQQRAARAARPAGDPARDPQEGARGRERRDDVRESRPADPDVPSSDEP